MFKAILSWLTGGVLDRLLSSVDHAIDNDTERQAIRAKVVSEYVRTAAETRQTAMQSRVFWWTWALFAVPLGVWWATICLDTVFLFSGEIDDLPDSVKPYANQIFAAVFGSGAGVASLQAISSAIRGRR
ncbi:hypothetical protein [Roseibium sp.]|uniref:hypothetical protein n=1 Tax=Roseibium sp. TaxID=1936156 RepID=UPI003B51BB82